MKAAALAVLVLIAATTATAAEPTRVAVTKDNSIVLVDKEWRDNAGRQGQIRIKGNQHLVAMMFDTKALEGRLILSATLVCPSPDLAADAKTGPIQGLTISTIAADWDEYKSNSLTSGLQPADGWGYPGARFPAVMGGNSFTLLCQARSVVQGGAYHWDVDPDLLHAIAIGAAHGLALQEWDADYSRNPLIYSREQSGHEPYLLVTFGDVAQPPSAVPTPEGGRATSAAPEPPTNLKFSVPDPADPAGVRLSLLGPKNGFAYEVAVNGKPLPRWDIPLVRPGEVQVIPIRDVPRQPTDAVQVTVTTVSRTGKRSEGASVRLVQQVAPLAPAMPEPAELKAAIARAPAGIAVIPEEDKYDAAGKPVGDLPADYRACNGVFDGRTIRLAAARGEVVGFQALLLPVAQPPSAVPTPEGGRATTAGEAKVTVRCDLPGLRTELYRAVYVACEGGRRIPDPLVPLAPTDPLPLAADEAAPVCVDVFVPLDFKGRRVEGTLAISDGRKVPVVLEVRGFAIPREASFACEMNGYGLPDKLSEFYRLQEIAYDHRVHVNLLAYSHSTAAPGSRKCNMDMVMDFDPVTGRAVAGGRRMDEKRYNAIVPGDTHGYWDDFIKAFGPYLSGKYFAQGYRGAVPAPGFYLTFHESWPLNVRGFFSGDPDAYEAFKGKPEYASTWVSLMKDFMAVARREGWERTGFQVYLNNKGSLRDAAKAPWILDEPTSYWDYRALAFYADLEREAARGGGALGLKFRIDISRPEFDRGQLEGKAGLWVVATDAFHNYHRLVADRAERTGERLWIYGSTNRVEESNRMVQAWALDAWRGGASGLVPWQTIDKDGAAMTKADQLGLFIFTKGQGTEAEVSGRAAIYHSMRLKAYRRAEQDVEYLEMLQSKAGLTPARVRAFIDNYVNLGGNVHVAYAEDAGTPEYGKVTPESLRRLREAAAAVLEKSADRPGAGK